MTETQIWQAVGHLGNALFFGRFLIQWLATERAKRITVPVSFWFLSLAGSLCIGAYAAQDGNLIFVAGPAVNFFIYARNLMIRNQGRRMRGAPLWAVAAGLFTLLIASWFIKHDAGEQTALLWLVIGIIGQLFWVLRFPLQWFYAERQGVATFPLHFFVVSFVGCLFLLVYAISTSDFVYIIGMALTPFLYGRQLTIAWRTRDAARDPGVPGAPQNSPPSGPALSGAEKA